MKSKWNVERGRERRKEQKSFNYPIKKEAKNDIKNQCLPPRTNPFSYEMTSNVGWGCWNREALSHFSIHSCHDHENDNKKWTSQFKRKLKAEVKNIKRNLLIHFIYKQCIASFLLRLRLKRWNFCFTLSLVTSTCTFALPMRVCSELQYERILI